MDSSEFSLETKISCWNCYKLFGISSKLVFLDKVKLQKYLKK